jgi:hypothetical protein
MVLRFLLPFCFLAAPFLLWSQTAQDAAVPLAATVTTTPPSVTLTWPNAAASGLLVQRRLKGQNGNQWTQLLNAPNSTQATLTDNNVEVGKTYEYALRKSGSVTAYGYAHVAVEAPVVDARGVVLLWIDSSLLAPQLAAPLQNLRGDLVGDGWRIVERHAGPAATVASVKSQIVADYNADPANVRAVFLLGNLPVPYSGNSAWDGHTDHNGAWPADGYYGDINGVWTDATVNVTTPTRAANHNVPGDGKFDQSVYPSGFGQAPLELQVGRVDFHNLMPADFGVASVLDLYERYLDKNHRWRTGQATAEDKALIDDNFGYFNGEAFAANGWRNAYPLVGAANVVEGDFFQQTNPQRYLMGYGTGGGNYNGAGGVGSSADFAADTVNIVFSMLFGSYHGDWDYEVNPFMPAALASRGMILACAWAGRPHWFLQGLASGETIGFCARETMNAAANTGYHTTFGRGGAHQALLGDPTVRAHMVAPPVPSLEPFISCTGGIQISWPAATDAAVTGYHVYRADSWSGPYTRLTTDLLSGTFFTDETPVSVDTVYYQVKAVRLETTPAGGAYYNASAGRILPVPAIFIPTVLTASAQGGVLTCEQPSVTLQGGANQPNATFSWSGPNGFFSNLQNPTVDQPGVYALTVTNASGCIALAEALVIEDTALPEIAIGPVTIDCNVPCPAVQLLGGSDLLYVLNGQTYSPGDSVILCAPGFFTGTYTQAASGCSGALSILVVDDTEPPVAFANGGELTCTLSMLHLESFSSTGIYSWTGPGGFTSTEQNPAVTQPGIYVLTVSDPANGCSSQTSVEVTQNISFEATVSATSESTPGAQDGTAAVTATGGSGEFAYAWNNGQTTPLITGLAGGIYTVTVTDQQSGCMTILTAEVGLLVTSEEPGAVEFCRLAPNPAFDATRLELRLRAPGAVSVSVVDAGGREVWRREEGEVLEQAWTIDVGGYAAGVYVVVVDMGEVVLRRRLVVVR